MFKKFVFLLIIITITLSICGCSQNNDVTESTSQIIVLPDANAKDTVNGYKPKTPEIKVEASENTSSNIDSEVSTVDDSDATIIGNSRSKKYHDLSCRYAKSLNPENKVNFRSPDDAIAAGYTPCGTCFKN